jgi:hypothetical protein
MESLRSIGEGAAGRTHHRPTVDRPWGTDSRVQARHYGIGTAVSGLPASLPRMGPFQPENAPRARRDQIPARLSPALDLKRRRGPNTGYKQGDPGPFQGPAARHAVLLLQHLILFAHGTTYTSTLYRYGGPHGELRKHGERVLGIRKSVAASTRSR